MSIASSIRVATCFLVAIFLTPSSWAFERNGNWWLTQTRNERLTYMVGFFDGMDYQLDEVSMELTNPLQWARISSTPCDEVCMKSRVEQSMTNLKSLIAASSKFKGVTSGQLVDGIDAMYADYRNRTILVKNILGVVMWSISGADQKAIDGRLNYLRSQK